MNATVTQDRITVYDIPEGKVHSVLATEGEQRVMSKEPMRPGLYLRDPLRSRPGQELMCLTPLDEAPAYSRIVRVSDVVKFARNFVPENEEVPA